MKLSERLKMLRNINGLTQPELALAIGISASAVYAYESGRQSPNVDVVLKICKKYEVSADWLLGLDEVQNKLDLAQIVRMLEAIEDNTNSLIMRPRPADASLDELSDQFIFMLFENEKIVKYFKARLKMIRMLEEELVSVDFYNAWHTEAISELEHVYDAPAISKFCGYHLVLEDNLAT